MCSIKLLVPTLQLNRTRINFQYRYAFFQNGFVVLFRLTARTIFGIKYKYNIMIFLNNTE